MSSGKTEVQTESEDTSAADAFLADYYAKRKAIEKEISSNSLSTDESEFSEAQEVLSQSQADTIKAESQEEKYNRSLKKHAQVLVHALMLSFLTSVVLTKSSLKN